MHPIVRSARYCLLFGTLFLLSTIYAPPNTFASSSVSLRSESLVRFFERDTNSETDALIAPAYEYLQLDIGKPGADDLTFHANGWGRLDLTDNDFFKDQTAGELLY